MHSIDQRDTVTVGLATRPGPAGVPVRPAAGPATGPAGMDAGDDELGQRRAQRAQTLGAVGAVMLAVSATSAGALPVTGEPALGWGIRHGGATPHLHLIGAYLGLTLIVWSWLALGRAVRAGLLAPRQVLLTAAVWAAPLLLAPPLYSRDVYSYVVQGAMYRDGVDPYRYGAASYGSEIAANVSDYWQNSTAPYGPVFLAIAAAVMTVAGSNVILGVLGMRLVMVAALAVTIVLVRRLARRYKVDESRALWLSALNPLVLFHVVSGVHNDILIVMLLLAAMVMAARNHPFRAAAVVGLAVLLKASAVVALVFLVPAAARRLDLRRWSLTAGAGLVGAVALATMASITAAIGGWYGWIAALADTTRVHNGLSLSTDLGAFLTWLAGTDTIFGAFSDVDFVLLSRVLALGLAGALLLQIMRSTRGKPVLGLGLALVMIVVLGPVVHPWYVLWGFIPLAATATRPVVQRFVIVASAALAFYPMPSGGGPTHELLLGLVGILLGLVTCAAVLLDRAPAWSVLPGGPPQPSRLAVPRTAAPARSRVEV